MKRFSLSNGRIFSKFLVFLLFLYAGLAQAQKTGAYYWGDGDGNGSIGGPDLNVLYAVIANGNVSDASEYTGYPQSRYRQDLDGNGSISGPDANVMYGWAAGNFSNRPGNPDRLLLNGTTNLSVNIGDSVTLQAYALSPVSIASALRTGLGVNFQITGGTCTTNAQIYGYNVAGGSTVNAWRNPSAYHYLPTRLAPDNGLVWVRARGNTCTDGQTTIIKVYIPSDAHSGASGSRFPNDLVAWLTPTNSTPVNFTITWHNTAYVTAITVNPASTSLANGSTTSFTATCTLSNGSTTNCTSNANTSWGDTGNLTQQSPPNRFLGSGAPCPAGGHGTPKATYNDGSHPQVSNTSSVTVTNALQSVSVNPTSAIERASVGYKLTGTCLAGTTGDVTAGSLMSGGCSGSAGGPAVMTWTCGNVKPATDCTITEKVSGTNKTATITLNNDPSDAVIGASCAINGADVQEGSSAALGCIYAWNNSEGNCGDADAAAQVTGTTCFKDGANGLPGVKCGNHAMNPDWTCTISFGSTAVATFTGQDRNDAVSSISCSISGTDVQEGSSAALGCVYSWSNSEGNCNGPGWNANTDAQVTGSHCAKNGTNGLCSEFNCDSSNWACGLNWGATSTVTGTYNCLNNDTILSVSIKPDSTVVGSGGTINYATSSIISWTGNGTGSQGAANSCTESACSKPAKVSWGDPAGCGTLDPATCIWTAGTAACSERITLTDVHNGSITDGATARVGTGWLSIASGRNHNCTVGTDGTLSCWGYNMYGQLGIGDTLDRATPTQIGSSTWSLVSAGQAHTCAIKTDGTLWCYGYNSLGQLGLGDTVIRYVPTQVGSQAYSKVSGGGDHTCAIQTDGTLWCWGDNSHGQLGDGTTIDEPAPVQGDTSNTWNQLSSGEDHTCAIKADHTLWCWGMGTNGQIGNKDWIDVLSPVQIGSDTDWEVVTAGSFHTCATKTDNSLWCWGSNGYGALGTGDGWDYNVPTLVDASLDWNQPAAGGYHTCATKTDNSLWCWGFNDYGELGDGTTAISFSPVQVGMDIDWAQLSAGGYHSCGLKTDNSAWCWGSNGYLQTGDSVYSYRNSPVQIGSTTDWAGVTAGGYFNCAADTHDTGWCWGQGIYGQLGNGRLQDVDVPTYVDDPNNNGWNRVSAGGYHICGTKADGTLWCWGMDDYGQLGDGAYTDNANLELIGGDTNWSDMASGFQHTCAIKTTGTLWCWGHNASGQLGLGVGNTIDTNDRNVPTQVGSDTNWQQIAAGGGHTCATKTNQSLYCWGDNSYGQLGIGSTVNTFVSTPTQESTLSTNWSELATGGFHTCARRSTGALYCWGNNYYYQLGLGNRTDQNSPTQVGSLTTWNRPTTGFVFSCSTKTDGTIWCWGDNHLGELGDGTFTDRSAPTQVGSATIWSEVSAGYYHACAVRSDNSLWCWGFNYDGQLGNQGAWYLTPQKVK